MTRLALGNAKALTVRCLSEVSWHDNARMRLEVLEAGELAADRVDVNWTPGNAGRRPCTGQDVAGGLGVQVAEAIKRLDALVVPGKVKTVLEGGRAYYAISEPAKS